MTMNLAKVKLFALIGDPIDQSLSPAMHNAAFRALGLNCAYVALRVPERFLPDAIGGIRALGMAGFNVTTPHKISIVGLLDELDESASLVGAVNTVKNDRGKLIGFNTDGEGALRALKGKIGPIKRKEVVLLGAGGAAHAIAFSLASAGARLTIANRTVPKARAFASTIKQKLGINVEVISLARAKLTEALKNADALINATSVGMYPRANQTLVSASMMHRGLIVNDIVYKPLRTRLLREARRAGGRTIDGLGMLVHQGALAFEIWTGKRAPIKVMDAAAKRQLRGESM
ncbi:MAG: shikimate dehydrogenase [Hadesarchaea archaeon]|nr:MAG: shikimate dehydrogenase [Hadesarchaea archaeon]